MRKLREAIDQIRPVFVTICVLCELDAIQLNVLQWISRDNRILHRVLLLG